MEAAYIRGKLSADEYLKQCAIVNPHLCLHYRITVLEAAGTAVATGAAIAAGVVSATRVAVATAPARDKGQKRPQPLENRWMPPGSRLSAAPAICPKQPQEIKPHPHGVELAC